MSLTKTITELVIVLSLISGSAAFAVERYADILPAARDVARAANAHQISVALELYASDHGKYPVYTGSDAAESWQKLAVALEGEYVQELPNDPSPDHAFRYWSDGAKAKVFYFSETGGQELERWNF